MRKLTVSGRYLSWEDGEPFFYLGDTAWELFHALSKEEMELFFKERARQGYTAIQSVALAENDGLRTPNYYGRFPLKTGGEGETFTADPASPDLDGEYTYWDHVDFAVETAAKYGLFIVMLPTWGDKFNICWGRGPVIFDPANAFVYGKWIANRYKDYWNIIWMLGGDRALETEEHRAIIDEMARGIREMDPNHLITFHPPGGTESTEYVCDTDYIDFHTSQTGHGIEKCYDSDGVMSRMAAKSEKPYMDSEPRYEDHPACFNDKIGYFWNAADVRNNAYWNILAGACGHTYGNHCIWSMTREPSSYFPFAWNEALTHIGAEQIGFVKKLRLSRDYFSLAPCNDVFVEEFCGMGHMTAAKGRDYAYVYSPLGVPFTVNLDSLKNTSDSKQIRASWFDPRTGEEEVFSIFPAEGRTLVVPPSQGKGCDWVLILEAC